MPDVSPAPAPASPRLTKVARVVRWLDDEGLDLYCVGTLAFIIIVIIALYVFLCLYIGLFVTTGDENTYYGPRMINTRFVGYIAGSIALIRQPYDHLCLHFWLPIHSEIS